MTTPGGESNRGQLGGVPMGGFSGGGVSGAVSVVATKMTGLWATMVGSAGKVEASAKRTRDHYEAAARAMGNLGSRGTGPRSQGLGTATVTEVRPPRRDAASRMQEARFGTPPPGVVPSSEDVSRLSGGRHAAPRPSGMPRPSFSGARAAVRGGAHGGGGGAAAFGGLAGGLLAAGAVAGLAGAESNMIRRDITSYNFALNGGGNRSGSLVDRQKSFQNMLQRTQFGYYSAADASEQINRLSTGFGVSGAGRDTEQLIKFAGGAAFTTPGFTGAQGASALQGLNAAPTVNFLRTMGVQARNVGRGGMNVNVANDIYDKTFRSGASGEQVAFSLREGGNAQQTIKQIAGGNAETEAFLTASFKQRAENGGKALNQTDQAAMEKLAPRTARRASELARAQEKNALTVQEGMVKGFEAATKTLEQFKDALNAVINTPPFNQAANIGAGGGIGGGALLGGIPGAGALGGAGGLLATYGAARFGAGRGMLPSPVRSAARGALGLGRGAALGVGAAAAGLGAGAVAAIGAGVVAAGFGIKGVMGADTSEGRFSKRSWQTAWQSGLGGAFGYQAPEKMASGGVVPGEHHNDTVPIQATPGEVVVPRGTVMKHGGAGNLMRKLGFSGGGRDGGNYAYGGEVTGDTDGLNPEFYKRLKAWSASVGKPYNVGSGHRSMEEQARLYDRWQRRVPGQAPAAKPGSSNHNFGLASDGPHWGGKNPGAFGLVYPMSYEPWHVEPVGAKGMRSGGGSAWKAVTGVAKKISKTVTKSFGAVKRALGIGGSSSPDNTPGRGKGSPALGFSGGQSLSLAAGVGLNLGTGAVAQRSGGDVSVGGSTAAAAASGDSGGDAGASDKNANVAIGKRLAAGYKWNDGKEWDALYKLFQKESGWSHTADNPKSSAYGIPQALISLHKMPAGYYDKKIGSGGSARGVGGNPSVQIKWGLDYIQGRYGSPSKAWAHHQANNSYSKGTMYAEDGGRTHAGELVVPARHAEKLRTLMRQKNGSAPKRYELGGEVEGGSGMGDMDGGSLAGGASAPDLGNSMPSDSPLSSRGSGPSQINVTIAAANPEEARKFALMLKGYLDQGAEDMMIGSS